MKKVDIFYRNKEKLQGVYIKDFESYDVMKLLNCDIWNMAGLSKTDKLKRFAAHLVCNPIEIALQDDHCSTSKNIAFEIEIKDQKRKDNKNIYDNLYYFIKPAQHYMLKKRYKANLSGTASRLIKIIKYSVRLKNFTWDEKIFLAAQLVMASDLITLLSKQTDIAHSRNMLIFQEHDTLSSTVIQYVHQRGVKVISPQHGMPLNRHEDMDQLFFEGFQCDYKLLWHEFEKRQYISAGIPEKHLFVVGNTKKLGREKDSALWQKIIGQQESKTGTFGIVLNCPENDGAAEYNKELLKIACRFARVRKLQGIVRLHPIDSPETYADVFDKRFITILEKGMSMDEFEKSIEFALGHLTGAIADLIYDGCFVFVYKHGQYYPIETAQLYEFDCYEKLDENYDEWVRNFGIYRETYKEIINLYRVENSMNLHKEFFERINDTNE